MLVIVIIGFGDSLMKLSQWAFADFIAFIVGVLVMVGLYVFVYNKRLLPRNSWKMILWVYVTYTLLDLIYASTQIGVLSIFKSNIYDLSFFGYLFAVLISLPEFYALYKLGYEGSWGRS